MYTSRKRVLKTIFDHGGYTFCFYEIQVIDDSTGMFSNSYKKFSLREKGEENIALVALPCGG